VANETAGAITFRISAGATLITSARYERIRFDSTGLTDGSTTAAAGELRSQVGRNDEFILNYNYQLSRTTDSDQPIHTALAGWERTFPRVWVGSASFGVVYLTGRTGAPGIWAPAGSVDLSARFRRGTLGARYDRTANQAFGLGRERLLDFFSLLASRSLGRRLELSGTCSYGISREPSDTASKFTTSSFAAGFRYRIARGLDLVGGYAFNRSDDTGATPALRNQEVSLLISLGRSRS
jgi:hypothetical protein